MRLSGLFGLCTSIAFVIGAASTALGTVAGTATGTRQTTIENAAGEKAKRPPPVRSDDRGEGDRQNREAVHQSDD